MNKSDIMMKDDWTVEDSRKFLEKAKAIKIAHCEKWGLPVPAFDKEEDYFSPEECHFCMTKKVEESGKLKLWMRSPDLSSLALWEYEANYCPMCGRKIKREKQNDT